MLDSLEEEVDDVVKDLDIVSSQVIKCGEAAVSIGPVQLCCLVGKIPGQLLLGCLPHAAGLSLGCLLGLELKFPGLEYCDRCFLWLPCLNCEFGINGLSEDPDPF